MTEGTGKQVFAGAIWMGSAKVIVNLLAFASTVVLARLLVPEDFGLVAIAVAVTLVLSSVSELSLSQALIKFDEPTDDDYATAWTLNLIRALLLAAIIIAVSIPVANAYSEPRLVPIFAVAALGAAVGALENPRIIDFMRALNFRPDFEISVAEKTASFVIAVPLALAYQTYWALIIGNVGSTFVRIALTYIKIPYRPRFCLASWRALFSFSIWLTFAQAMKTVNLRSVPLIVGAFLPTSAVGNYSIGDRIASMPIREGVGALQSTLFPAFSRMSDDLPRMRRAYVRAQAMTSLLALPAGFGMAAVAEPLVSLFLGSAWLPAVPIVQAVAIASGIQAIQNVMPLAMVTGRTNEVLWRNLRAFCIQMPLIVLGLHIGRSTDLGGLNGLAIALVASVVCNTTVNLLLVRKLIASPLKEQVFLAARPLAASLFMLACIQIVGSSFALTANFWGACSYLFVLLAFGFGTFALALFALHALFATSQSAELELYRVAKNGIVQRLSRH